MERTITTYYSTQEKGKLETVYKWEESLFFLDVVDYLFIFISSV